ncbi:MAG: glucose-6-phosphate dehydrogenase assembly protein OpcA [Bryobacteraceae bacterium]
MAAAVRPEKILKDLAKLWVDLGKEDSQKGSAGVLRACAMTLIAAVEEEAEAAFVSETLAELMHQHPSRAIVLRVCGDRESALDARVFAQCWMPFGRHQQICCEQIEITASPARVDDLPKLVLGLMVPDLPVVLWCRSERVGNLFPLANKIIVDTESVTEPRPQGSGLAYVRQLTAEGYNVADLAWTRLTRWRDSIAHIFDSANARQHLGSIDSVTITHAGPEAREPLPSRLAYLAAWFKHTLPSRIHLVFKASATDSDRMIQGIELSGLDFRASVRLEGASAVVTVDELTRRIPFPKLTDCELLREELGILGTDPVFRRCLE